jgi:RsiW-degrading membrane proteinase PrsW (M82 family)
VDPFASQDLFFAYALLQAVIVLLLIRFVDLYEREPIPIVFTMFFWGAIGAAILASIGNVALVDSLPEEVDVVFGEMISAPIVEELAKGLALIAAFMASRWAAKRFGLFEFDGPTDGIVYGAAIGIGFAFTEDLYYFFRVAQETDLSSALDVYLDRRDFLGPAMLRHAIWTATFGAALGLATWARKPLPRYGIPIAGLLLAMLMHAVNNGLINVVLSIEYGFQTTYDFLTVGVPISLADRMDATQQTAEDALNVIAWIYVIAFIAAIAYWLHYQRRLIATELVAERELGSVTEQEARLAPTFVDRNRYYLGLLRAGQAPALRNATRLYGEIVDLAFARRRHEGEEQALSSRRRSIGRLREQVADATEPPGPTN